MRTLFVALLVTILPAQWQRTFTAPMPGTYQVVLPFKPGEWTPLDEASFLMPYAAHPDGSVSRVALIFQVSPGTYTITPQAITLARGLDRSSKLPPPPVLTVNQGAPQWTFSTDHPGNSWRWITTNKGLVAHRVWTGRLVNGPWGAENTINRCDFGLRIWLLYWQGRLVRTEVLLIGCRPDHPTERNWPLTGGVFLDGREIMRRFNREKIGDLMSVWYREDSLIYGVCDDWAGHLIGGHGVDYTKVKGGSLSRLLSAAKRRTGDPWWHAFWGHPNAGGSTGMHGDFGVCLLDVAAGLQAKNIKTWPALHELCTEWLSSPYHIVDMDGKIQRQKLVAGGEGGRGSWTLGLGDMDDRAGWPQFGKTQDAEKPDRRGRTSEDAAHMRSNSLAALMHICPTPLFLDEMNHRAENMLKIYGGEERAYARYLFTGLEMLPFLRGERKKRLLVMLKARTDYKLQSYKGAGYRASRESGPWDQWIPGKKVFLPWQDQMLLGAILAQKRSGWIPLSDDQKGTLERTARWFADTCWRQRSDGSWESPYAHASDLSEAAWSGDPGIFGQGIAGLEAAGDHAKAKQILGWWAQTEFEYHPSDRWVPRR